MDSGVKMCPFGTISHLGGKGDVVVWPCEVDLTKGGRYVVLCGTTGLYTREKLPSGKRVEYRVTETGSGRGPKGHYDFGVLVDLNPVVDSGDPDSY